MIAMLAVLAVSPGSFAAAKSKAKPKPKVPVTTTIKAPVNKLYSLTATGTYDTVNEGGGEKGSISLQGGVRVQRLSDGTRRTTGSGELQVVGYMIDYNMPDDKVCQTPAAGKILAPIILTDYDVASELSSLPPVGSIAFSLILRVTAPGTGPGVGCPDGSTLTFDGLYAADTFQLAGESLAFAPTGGTLHRTSKDPLIRYDMTFTLVPLN